MASPVCHQHVPLQIFHISIHPSVRPSISLSFSHQNRFILRLLHVVIRRISVRISADHCLLRGTTGALAANGPRGANIRVLSLSVIAVNAPCALWRLLGDFSPPPLAACFFHPIKATRTRGGRRTECCSHFPFESFRVPAGIFNTSRLSWSEATVPAGCLPSSTQHAD